jgi:hypothetical protein
MYELHQGYYGYVSGDGYKLISTSLLSGHETRVQAWEAFYAFEGDKFELLVKKPEYSNNEAGYPSCWDDPIDLNKWRAALHR